MELANKTRLAAHSEHYRLWFEYLRVAIERTPFDKVLAKAIKKSTKFYASWEMEKKLKFNAWWKSHGHLFEEKYNVRELAHGESPLDPEAIVIEVPLRFSATELSRHTAQIIKLAAQRRIANTKSKKQSSAKYALTSGAEPKLVPIREMLTVYRDIQIPNLRLKLVPQQSRALHGSELLEHINAFYKNRKNKRWAKVPSPLTINYKTDRYYRSIGKIDKTANSNALRSLRRYIQKAEKIVLNVARGEFPGKY